MYGNYIFSLQEFSCNSCVFGVHSKVAADGEHSIVESIKLREQLHVAVQCSITGKINLGTVEIYYEAAGMAAGNAAAVESHSNTNLAERGT